jgi:alpha-glucuronidase
LADALKPFGGMVVWRSFVYGANHKGEGRGKQAVSEVRNSDGMFRDNVILQSKNGPLDFQPREPYAPIFDQMQHTRQVAEWQITQVYRGQSKHLVLSCADVEEFFHTSPGTFASIAGVANIGDDAIGGTPFSQATGMPSADLHGTPPNIRADCR